MVEKPLGFSFRKLGDINGDNKITVTDLVIICKAFGSKPRDANWNPDADLNDDGKVTVTDLMIASQNFGWKCERKATTIEVTITLQGPP